jgi:hypothetical protein
MRRFLLAGALITGLTFGVLPAGAATHLGGDTFLEPDGQTGCGAENCTLAFGPAGPTNFIAPADGVIVNWSIVTLDGIDPGDGVATWRLRTVVRDGLDGKAIRSAPAASVEPGARRAFSVRVPIAAGEAIAVDGPPSGTAALRYVGGGGSLSQFFPPLPDGGPFESPPGNGGGFTVLFGADMEADVDRDVFGDESQDACPADAARHEACVTFTKKPKQKVKTRKKRSKAKFRFTAGAPALQCKLDAAAFAACSSPLTLKVRRGSHTLQVRAVNATGIVDPVPAVYKWKVKRKRGKKK